MIKNMRSLVLTVTAPTTWVSTPPLTYSDSEIGEEIGSRTIVFESKLADDKTLKWRQAELHSKRYMIPKSLDTPD